MALVNSSSLIGIWVYFLLLLIVHWNFKAHINALFG